ncbi:MAG TPA: penicillin-binding protein 2 [Candidatus Uhrbacteria bacterium]|nr:penicillin-binding protein 2 [Candidatus Uhrbacteria bacterium]
MKYLINRKYKNCQEIDESFFYEEDSNRETEKKYEGEDKFLGKHLTEKKINFIAAVIALVLIVLFGRAFGLQITKGEYYESLAEKNRMREKTIVASRGLIYDKNMKPLVKNYPIFDAFVLPNELSFNQSKREEQIEQIAIAIGEDFKNLAEILDKYPRNFKYPLAVKENIDYEEALLLKIKSEQMQGLFIEAMNRREYVYSNEFSHILGYIGKIADKELNERKGYLLTDYIGKTGLESFYEDSLRGKYGKEMVEVDVAGREKKVIYYQEVENGNNLVLSVESDVQKKAREILNKHLEKLNKKRASLIMLNPQNGEIIALVSLPDFDVNLFSRGISLEDYKRLTEDENKPLFPRAIRGEYASGSTIKPVVAAGALEEDIINERTIFLSTGGLWVFDRWFFPDWAAGGHGLTNIYRAIAWSVNTYFYIIGGGYQDFQGLGAEGLKKYYELFGLGQKTGLDLGGESAGLVPDPEWKKSVKNEDWYIGDTYHMSIGQGYLLATPLQVANFTSVFANGGKLFQPHFVKEIISNTGEVQKIEPVIIRENFISQANINIIKKAMRQTVTLGSAQYLNNLKVEVSGKTGTAQWHSNKQPHSWFAGFAPYDAPEVVITVLVEEGGEGSAVSVPIAYDVLKWYFEEYKNE